MNHQFAPAPTREHQQALHLINQKSAEKRAQQAKNIDLKSLHTFNSKLQKQIINMRGKNIIAMENVRHLDADDITPPLVLDELSHKSQKSQASTHQSSNFSERLLMWEDSKNSSYLKPITVQSCQRYKTKRLSFSRRKTHSTSQVVILNLEGVIGTLQLQPKPFGRSATRSFKFSSINDVELQQATIQLRHEVIAGLQELKENFQVILVSPYSEQLTCAIVQELKELDKESKEIKHIHFDAIYCFFDEQMHRGIFSNSSSENSLPETLLFESSPSHSLATQQFSFNQIYADFEVISLKPDVKQQFQMQTVSFVDIDYLDGEMRAINRLEGSHPNQVPELFSFTDKIEKEVLIVAAINKPIPEIEELSRLPNSTLSQKLFSPFLESECHSKLQTCGQRSDRCYSFNGLPVESENMAPLVVLVPDMQSQPFHRSVSFLQVIFLIAKLQVVSYFVKKDTVNEFTACYQRDRMKQNQILLNYNVSRQGQVRPRSVNLSCLSPLEEEKEPEKPSTYIVENHQRNSASGVFTVTTIQPTNIYKKILAQCKDKSLDRETCHFLSAFYLVDKYKLFDCKPVQSILMSEHPFRQETVAKQVAQLKMHMNHLKNYEASIKNMAASKAPKKDNMPSEVQKQYIDLLRRNNDQTQSSISEYHKEQFRKVQFILQTYTPHLEQARTRQSSGNDEELLIHSPEERGCHNYTFTGIDEIKVEPPSYSGCVSRKFDDQLEQVTKIQEYIQKRIDKLQAEGVECSKAKPIHRFLVFLGHKYQNYPPQPAIFLHSLEVDDAKLPMNLSQQGIYKSLRGEFFPKKSKTSKFIQQAPNTQANNQHPPVACNYAGATPSSGAKNFQFGSQNTRYQNQNKAINLQRKQLSERRMVKNNALSSYL